jgi:hypothetical protein
MKRLLVPVFALIAGASFGQHPVSAFNFDGSLDAFVDGNPGVVTPLEYRMIGSPTVPAGDPTYTTATVGPTTKQVANFAVDTFFRCNHGMLANGHGAYVNNFTILLDVKFDATDSDAWCSLFNTTADDQNDGDSFIRWDGTDGIGRYGSLGISGLYGGTVYGGRWNRIIVTVECGWDSGSGTRLTYYVNGAPMNVSLAGSGTDGRWALYSVDDGDTDSDWVDLLADNDYDQTMGQVSCAALYDRVLTPDECFMFGGPGRFVVPGDANLDGGVDIGDYALLSAAFNSSPGDPNWNENCDFNNDETIDIGDYGILSANFGS